MRRLKTGRRPPIYPKTPGHLPCGISLDQSRVLAMRTAGETPGVYGRKLTGIPMAFEVVGEEETEGHYNITLSFRPQGTFAGTPGQEQFFIDKEGSVVHRQVLELPVAESARRIPVVPVVAGLAAVATAAVIGFVVVQQVGGEGDGIQVPTAGPAAASTSQPAPETAQAVPAPAALAAAAPLAAPAVAATIAPRGGGTAVIWDDDALSDAITYSMTGMAPPDEGKAYVGWLVSDDGFLKLSTGPITVKSDGTIDYTMDHNSRGYSGLNLLHTFSKVVVTLEESRPMFDTPLGPPMLSHQVPLGAMQHIRHLLTSWPAGSGRGILTNLKEQLGVAAFHANLAQESNTLEDIKKHTEHVINIIEGHGGPNYGDLDGDGVVEDPGSGIGVLTHAIDRKHGKFAASEAPEDPVIASHAALVDSYGKVSEDLAVQARDLSLQILDAEDLGTARALMNADTGDDTVASLLAAALDGQESTGQGGAGQAYVEAQLMATYTLKPEGSAAGPAPGSIGHITYSLPSNRVYRVEAREGATPEDISAALDALSPGAKDLRVNASPDGEWLVVDTERFDPECEGWACLAIVSGDLSSGEAVYAKLPDREVVHHAEGSVAVASSGDLIVYQQEGVVGDHVADLFAVTRNDGEWGTPQVLTGDSPYMWHMNPAISGDGSALLYQCGNDSRNGHAICEVGTDGTGFRVVLTPADSPLGGPDTGTLHNPDYAPDGSIVFAADWDGDQVWRLPSGASEPVLVLGDLSGPCVLADGRIAGVFQDWSTPGASPDLHIRVSEPSGSGFVTVATIRDTERVSEGLGCGG